MRCTLTRDQPAYAKPEAYSTAAVKSQLTVMALLQQKPCERCAQCKWR